MDCGIDLICCCLFCHLICLLIPFDFNMSRYPFELQYIWWQCDIQHIDFVEEAFYNCFFPRPLNDVKWYFTSEIQRSCSDHGFALPDILECFLTPICRLDINAIADSHHSPPLSRFPPASPIHTGRLNVLLKRDLTSIREVFSGYAALQRPPRTSSFWGALTAFSIRFSFLRWCVGDPSEIMKYTTRKNIQLHFII